MKPTFFVIGAAKCGSTTLCHHLGTHPDVFFSPRKELHFFSFDAVYAQGVPWYERWFEDGAAHAQRGEGSQSYTSRKLFPDAAARLAAYAPEARLIYVVRDPMARIESLWMQLRRFGATSPFADLGQVEVPRALHVDLDFRRALRAQAEGLLDSTDYAAELDAYRAHFPDERILVLTFEALRADPRAELRRAFAFLDVDPDAVAIDPAVHLNPMAHYSHPRAALWRLWASPRRRRAYSAVARLVPTPVRGFLNRRLLRRKAERPAWDAESCAWAWARIGPGVERFARTHGVPAGAWRMPFAPTPG